MSTGMAHEEAPVRPFQRPDRALLFKKLDIKLRWLVAPCFAAFLASIFDGVSFALLIPAIRGILSRDFGFIKDEPALRPLLDPALSAFGYGNTAALAIIIGLIFVFALLKHIFLYGASLGFFYTLRRFSDNLRRRIYERYLSFGKLFFDKNNSGVLYQVIVDFVGQISHELEVMETSLFSLFTISVYYVIMLFISWKLTLFVSVVLPVLYFSLRWLIKMIERSSDSLVGRYATLTKSILNALSSIPLVKAYRNEEKELSRFYEASNNVRRIQFSIDKKRALISPFQEIILLCMILLTVAAAAALMIREESGDVAGYLVFFLLLRRSTLGFGFVNRMQGAAAALKGPVGRIREVFADEDKYFIADGRKEFAGLESSVEFDGLSFSYPGRECALKDVSFRVNKGQAAAIVGATGGGKTTIINLLMRFYDPSSGSVRIDGVDIREYTLKSLRSKMAMVSQEAFIFDASVRFNIVYGMEGRISGRDIEEAIKKAELGEMLDKLPEGLDTKVGEKGVKLSGGEKQRIAIARAFLKKADILLLDEATSSLDSVTESLIQKALGDLMRGRTAVVVAHRLSTIRNADLIVVVEEGRVVETGTPEELAAGKGRFSAYMEKQDIRRESFI